MKPPLNILLLKTLQKDAAKVVGLSCSNILKDTSLEYRDYNDEIIFLVSWSTLTIKPEHIEDLKIIKVAEHYMNLSKQDNEYEFMEYHAGNFLLEKLQNYSFAKTSTQLSNASKGGSTIDLTIRSQRLARQKNIIRDYKSLNKDDHQKASILASKYKLQPNTIRKIIRDAKKTGLL